MSHRKRQEPPRPVRLQLGARVTAHPYMGHEDQSSAYPGTVIHINRRHRHYTLRFDFPYGRSFCQTFHMEVSAQ